MLRKLYKHELYALLRNLIPFYIGVIALSLISRGMLAISSIADNIDSDLVYSVVQFLSSSVTTFYVISLFAIFIVSLVFLVIRFYKHLLTGEGYLSMSLPISVDAHIICKAVCACIMALLSVAVVIASLLIISAGNVNLGEIIYSIGASIRSLQAQIGASNFALFAVELLLLVVLSLISSLFMFYCAIALGQSFKSRIGGAVIAYIILYAIEQTIGMGMLVITMVFASMAPVYEFFHTLFWLSIIIKLGTFAAYYFITRHMLKNRLNLE